MAASCCWLLAVRSFPGASASLQSPFLARLGNSSQSSLNVSALSYALTPSLSSPGGLRPPPPPPPTLPSRLVSAGLRFKQGAKDTPPEEKKCQCAALQNEQ